MEPFIDILRLVVEAYITACTINMLHTLFFSVVLQAKREPHFRDRQESSSPAMWSHGVLVADKDAAASGIISVQGQETNKFHDQEYYATSPQAVGSSTYGSKPPPQLFPRPCVTVEETMNS